MEDTPDTEWIASFAHGLQRHWRRVDPEELEVVAAELSHDQHLRAMRPADAAVEWLRPVTEIPVAWCPANKFAPIEMGSDVAKPIAAATEGSFVWPAPQR